jgi:hypothetical protein
LHASLLADANILAILEQGKILTGDEIRTSDVGYEFEVPPKGHHVALLSSFLGLLGFDVHEGTDPADGPDDVDPWWTDDLADAWEIMQELSDMETVDGVVEKEVLRKVLVPPAGFMLLKSRVEGELSQLKLSNDAQMHHKRIPEEVGQEEHNDGKPSFDALCKRLSMTMARMLWLHKIWESYVQESGDAQRCLYPQNPAQLKKQHVQEMMAELLPHLTTDEFEECFQKIDSDGNGTLEFDEFVVWISEDEVRLRGSIGYQGSFEHLALDHDEPLALIMRLYDQFCELLPKDIKDHYPTQPAKLHMDAALSATEALNPPKEDEDVASRWDLVDEDGSRDSVHFGEFLEMLDFAELPAELRKNLHSTRRTRRSLGERSHSKTKSNEPTLGVINE